MTLRTLSILTTLVVATLLAPATALASTWWNHDWSFRKQITLDASAKGADVKTDLASAVVLVRLHEGVFKFSDAMPDGSDLRFIAEDDKTPLKFHIEKYDSVFNLAFVWVQLPQVTAGAPLNVWMYYGNASAPPGGGDARETYDPLQTLVYHLGDKGPAQDATGYRNHATGAAALDESGLIGGAAKFDGNVIVSLPASPSLAVAAGGTLTWSAWIKPANPSEDGVLYAMNSAGRPGLVIGLAKGQPYVSVADASGEARQSPFLPPITDTNWHHLALVAGVQTTLFLDGQPGPAFATPLPVLDGAPSLGGGGGGQNFRGEIDELQVSKVARDPALIRLEALNQGANDRLVSFGGDEGLSSIGTGYFGIILHAVTFDAWVVIGILMLMALVSWIVMFTKNTYINRVSRANTIFNTQFHTLRQDLTNLESAQKLKDEERARLPESSLYRMYEVGVREIKHRFDIQGHASALSAESIEAIRASVDAASVRENQRLGKAMVMLTIAISGGPFVGLLGTVVGVMITFAAVAAAGDVNINAIAPGISAALLATAAGMFVAIPALFGYNYLVTRIKEIQADMAVFVDEFVTRMAEMYPASAHSNTVQLKSIAR